ncbi:hypothetical protein [Streptomyces sp. 4N124]|uniref:hypothetical protein n=1 Tax=Streptomyces sp. 4N124 TaxID=3457420 RepID=UPI003FD0E141
MARNARRAAVAAAGALTLAGALLAGTASADSAQDSRTSSHGERLSTEEMKSAVSVSAARMDVGPMVGGPWSDPEPARFYPGQPNSAPNCATGYACMKIKEGSQPTYTDFWYYFYGLYEVENWIGRGYLNNRQYSGTSFRTYNASGGLIDCYSSYPTGSISNPNWTPVYYIRLSPAGC